MGAQSVFLTSTMILLLFNAGLWFSGIPGITMPNVSTIINTIVAMVAILVVGSITIFGSGLDTRIYRYIFALAVVLGLCFSVTIQYSSIPTDTFTVGVGLVTNLLSPFWGGSTFIDMVGLVVAVIFSMVFLVSGLIIVIGPAGD